jgi:endonuclease/exonuclease/phosphatase family metal-dependent hydrolase
MGKLAVYKYFSFLFLIATFLMTGFTFFGLFGGNVPPAGNTARAMLVYILPVLIFADLLLLVYWLVRRRWHWAVIPFITILCCIPYIGTLYQPGSPDSAVNKKAGLVVATYNVARFGRETTGFIATDILAQMKKQKVDVLCIQEYNETSGDKRISDIYKDYFNYMAVGMGDMVIFSRYPIIGEKTIAFEDTNNSAMWADIDVNGREFRIVNVHLQTTGVNSTLHQAAKMQMQGADIQGNRLLKAIYGNYTMGMMVRAGQAVAVRNELKVNHDPKKSLLICGDFNDVPYSYVYNTMLGDLIDGFKECGSGWMSTFRGRKSVRIDYIFHDESVNGLSCFKLDLSYSDHYPVFMKLEL